MKTKKKKPKPTFPGAALLKSAKSKTKIKDHGDLFEKVAQDVIHDQREVFDSLKPSERAVVMDWLTESLVTGDADNKVSELLWELDYVRKPVDIETFLSDHYYFGGNFVDREDECTLDRLAPVWIDDLKAVFAPGSTVTEWIQTGGIGIGKLQRTGDYVLTPTGWAEIGSLEVGDRVVGSQGLPVKVLGVYPHKNVQMYRVTFKDGSFLDVGEDHLWRVQVLFWNSDGQRDWTTQIVDTKTLALQPLKRGDSYRFRIPLVKPVVFDACEKLPVAPYTMGALLGDGCFTKGTVTLAGDDDEVGDRVQQELPGLKVNRSLDLRQWTISRGEYGGVRDGNWLMSSIRRLGLEGADSHTKFIPHCYLRASAEKRLELLRGLMDTDGSVCGNNRSVFCTVNKRMACGVQEIVWSLGGLATLTDFHRRGGVEYHVHVNLGDVCPFWMQRKARAWKPRTNQKPVRAIVSVEKIDVDDGVCIRVDAPDQLYVAKDYIVTHNTTIAMIAEAYSIYRMSCLRNPAEYYGLPARSPMIFGIYSITKRQVTDTGYSMLRGHLDSSPYFQEEFSRSYKIDSMLDFQPTTHIPLKVISGCVAEGTLIDTPCGGVPVEKLTDRSGRVMSLSRGEWKSALYSGVVDSGVKRCLELKTESGYTLVCSEDHQILTPCQGRTGYRFAKDLTENDSVYVVRKKKTHDDVLFAERESAVAVQGVCEAEKQGAVSRYENVRGQEISPVGRAEDLYEMRSGEAIDGVWCEDGEEPIRPEEVPAFVVQTVQQWSGLCILPEKLVRAPGLRPKEKIDTGVEKPRARTLEEVLCDSSGQDIGAHVIARRPCQAEPTTARLAFGEPGEISCVLPRLVSTQPGTRTGTVSQVGKDETGADYATCLRIEAASEKEVIDGDAYFLGYRIGDRVFWEKMLLLWTEDQPHHGHDGSCGSAIERRHDYTREHCAVLPFLQQQQERFRPASVVEEEKRFGRGCDIESDSVVCAERVVSVREVGLRKTYDVVHVGTETHSISTNGIVSSNSQELHALGLNLFSMAMDEVNFMRAKNDKDSGKQVGQAYDLYNAVRTRIKSRFLRPGGTVPGITILMSSRNAQTSFLERRINEACDGKFRPGMKGQLNDSTYLSDYTLWETKPPEKFSKKRFRVEVGDRVSRSRILGEKEKPRQGSRIVTVPEDFRDDFEKDTDQALRDIAGVATFNVSPLIYDNQSVYDALCEGLVHPFSRDITTLREDDDLLLETYFRVKDLCRVVNSKWVPKYEPHAPRFIHIDIGLTGDSAGVAMSHPSARKEVRVRNPDGTTSIVVRPIVTVDFMMKIVPPSATEIPIWKLRSFVLYLSKIFHIARVSLDGFQSRDTVQLLNREFIPSVILSLDRDDEQYLTLRSCLSERRLLAYDYEPFVREMLDLQTFYASTGAGGSKRRRKVDHPEFGSDGLPGSKDVSDAVCGSVWHCIHDDAAKSSFADLDVFHGVEAETVVRHKSAVPKIKTTKLDAPEPAKKNRVNMSALRRNLLKGGS